jgi:hypothetical protein
MKDTKSALPADFEVEPVSSADAARLGKFNIDLEVMLKKGSFSVNPNVIVGGGDIAEYHYRIKYEEESAKLLVTQPFTLMDLPGGWLDIEKRPPEKWNTYRQHLHNSIALWVPIDAPLLFEARTPDERGVRARLLSIGAVGDVVQEWAKYRVKCKSEPAVLCLAPIKCETYFSKADKPDKTETFFSIFMAEYGTLINKVKETCPHCQVYYTPVESIGPIKLSKGVDWNIETGNTKVSYMLTGHEREIAGAEALTSCIYQYGGERIIEEVGKEHLKRQAELKKNSFKRLDKEWMAQLEAIQGFYQALLPVSKVLTELAERGKRYKYFKEL